MDANTPYNPTPADGASMSFVESLPLIVEIYGLAAALTVYFYDDADDSLIGSDTVTLPLIGAGSSSFNLRDIDDWTGIIYVAAGWMHTVGVKDDGACLAVGYNTSGQCDVTTWSDVVSVACGAQHTVGLKSDGTCVAVGYNYYGQCNVTGWTDIVFVCANFNHTIGVKSDGTCVHCGSNGTGQGNVGSWTDIVSAGTGTYHTVGVKSDGTCVAVGSNTYGQCDVTGWGAVAAVACGAYHTIGLKINQTCLACGQNTDSQCEVGSWAGVVGVAAGSYHTVGVKSDGACLAVGSNTYGQCEVGSWSDVDEQVAAGSYHTIGLKYSGTPTAGTTWPMSDPGYYEWSAVSDTGFVLAASDIFGVTLSPHQHGRQWLPVGLGEINARLVSPLGLGEIIARQILAWPLGAQATQTLLAGLGLSGLLSDGAGFGIQADQREWPNGGAMSILSGLLNYGTFAAGDQFYLLKLLRGDPAAGLQAIVYKIVENITGRQVNRHDLLPALLSDSAIQALKNILSEAVNTHQTVRQTITGEAVQSIHTLLLTLLTADALNRQQHMVNSLSDPAAQIHAVTRAVYLDGRTITGLVSSVTIERDQSNVLNSVSIASIDADLYQRAAPVAGEPTARLEIHIGSEVLYFLLEQREGSPRDGFTLWGRDRTAAESEEYAGSVTLTLSAPTLASEVAASLAVVSAVDWAEDCEDWLLPASFRWSGAPIDGIVAIAAESGAIVRAQADGSLLVRNKYPVRPKDLPETAAAVNYDQAELIALARSERLSVLVDAVTISNSAETDVFLPQMETEESSPEVGQTVHIRVYWGANANTTIDRYVTAGSIVREGEFIQTVTELVEFTAGVASLTYPLEEVVRMQWYGDTADLVENPGTRELQATDPDGGTDQPLFRLGQLTYTTKYERLRLNAGSVSAVMAVLFLAAADDILLDVIAADAADPPVFGDVVTTSFLTGVSIARARGTAYLDDHHYNYVDVTLSAPYDADAGDGVVAYINDMTVGGRSNYQIMRSDIVVTGPKIINQITVRKWLT